MNHTASLSDGYPAAKVPVLPVPSLGAFVGRHAAGMPLFGGEGVVLPVASGTAAIALALKLLGVRRGHNVLLPAYHCTSMIEPVLWRGAEVRYYRVTEDLAVDLDDALSKIDRSTRALLVVHYFGFPQNISMIQSACDASKIALIEDCAHAYYGSRDGRALGSFGDCAIASPRKFFPVYDGGALAVNRTITEELKLKSPNWTLNAKAAFNLLEMSIRFGRLRPLDIPLRMPLRLLHAVRRRASAEQALRDFGGRVRNGDQKRYMYFDPATVDCGMSIVSRLGMRLTPQRRIVERRRSHYAFLARTLSGIPNGRPLFPRLPADVVPYMFPFVIDQPSRVFPALKWLGVPIWRWEQIHTSVCPVSNEYAQRLLQLPCHQELRADELQWIAESLTDTLARDKN